MMSGLTFSFLEWAMLFGLGVVCGVINVMAGGGSNLTLPALMMMGLPPALANATNRLGIFLQNVVGIWGFRRKGRLPTHDLPAILAPTLIGGLIGALCASYAPPQLLKALLLGTMLLMSAIILLRPSVVMAEPDTVPFTVQERQSAFWWLFLAGLYGGFVQAGVGFVLITAIAGSLRYDLVATNALKLVCALSFTAVALLVFIAREQVLWDVGLVLAAGNMLGAYWGVNMAIKVKPHTMKKVLFVMTLAAVVAAFLKP